MKRILLCMFLVALLVFSLASCGSGNDETSEFNANNVSLLSAYNEAEKLGFEGTLEEFIALISGKDGAPGKDGITPTVEISSDGYWIINGEKTDVIAKGEKGDTGAPGKDGEDGKDGAPGNDGVNGKDGAPGKDGAQGVGIKTVAFDENGDLLITFTDNSTQAVEMPKTQEQTHSFGEWKSFSTDSSISCDERFFYRTCADCNLGEFKKGSPTDHKFETVTTKPTCTKPGFDINTCSVCGRTEIVNEIVSTSHSYTDVYLTDNSFHWKKCTQCTTTTEKQEHTQGDDGMCTVCNAPVGATEGIKYELSQDGEYAMVIGYNGASKQIRIAEEYQGKPVEQIAYNAFENNKTINSVIIPDSVTIIGDDAFSSCTKLTSVIIGNGVKEIRSGTFSGCTQLQSITIGSSVESISEYAFSGCTSLANLHITDVAKLCSSTSKFFYSTSAFTTNLYVAGELVTDLVIPDGVTEISEYAFYNFSGLISVTIPDSVTTIGGYAFGKCKNLENISVGANVNSVSSTAFNGCNSAVFKDYKYGSYIGNNKNPYAILLSVTNKGMESYEIHPNTQVIAESAFYNCSGLTSVEIPSSITSIGNNAFYGCQNLEGVYISDLNAWCNISFCAPRENYGTTTAHSNPLEYAGNLYLNNERVTELVLPDGITCVNSHAFYGCISIESVTIPSSITKIGYSAFSGCKYSPL